jgi:hypothetical protein
MRFITQKPLLGLAGQTLLTSGRAVRSLLDTIDGVLENRAHEGGLRPLVEKVGRGAMKLLREN